MLWLLTQGLTEIRWRRTNKPAAFLLTQETRFERSPDRPIEISSTSSFLGLRVFSQSIAFSFSRTCMSSLEERRKKAEVRIFLFHCESFQVRWRLDVFRDQTHDFLCLMCVHLVKERKGIEKRLLFRILLPLSFLVRSSSFKSSHQRTSQVWCVIKRGFSNEMRLTWRCSFFKLSEGSRSRSKFCFVLSEESQSSQAIGIESIGKVTNFLVTRGGLREELEPFEFAVNVPLKPSCFING